MRLYNNRGLVLLRWNTYTPTCGQTQYGNTVITVDVKNDSIFF